MNAPAIRFFLVFAIIVILGQESVADIVARRSLSDPNDLEILFTSEITAVASDTHAADFRWGIRLNDVYVSSQANNVAQGLTTATISLDGTIYDRPFFQSGILAFGSSTGRDLLIFWEDAPIYSPSIGDTIVVSQGSYILDDFLLSSLIPDTNSQEISVSIVTAASGNSIAELAGVGFTSVPEPSLTCFTLVATLMVFRRRNRKSRSA